MSYTIFNSKATFGIALHNSSREMLSSAVVFGTVQLLPNGQLICLMADHQTTGGYPRVAQVAQIDLPVLAQCSQHDDVCFQLVALGEAENLVLDHIKRLKQIQAGCQWHLKSL
ncbi:MAG: hypothetical protein ACKO96_21850 [Flammeovirgaceae bacterium]